MFRRRKRQEAEEPEAVEAAEGTEEAGAAEEPAPVPLQRPQGPWDAADAPDDGLPRVDLGAMRVPVPPDAEVRVDVNAEGGIVAATVVRGAGQVQVNVFAAPRSEGIWSEVRDEIRTALLGNGGRAEVRDGTMGVELHALVPTEVPGRGVALAPARFCGVDGPRWFLRALFTGAAATDPEVAAPLEAAVRAVVVVRGNDPMAVRDPLPLRLPPEASAAPAGAAAPEAPEAPAEGAPPLEMPERGPEITETR